MMKIGLIGLGKMGANLARQMHGASIPLTIYNRSSEKTKVLEQEGLEAAYSLTDLLARLEKPKVIWLMVPSGETVDVLIDQLIAHLEVGDILIDGGNSNYKETQRRAEMLQSEGICMLDIGTSGGTSGARNGACMMVGGAHEDYVFLKPLLEKLCVPGGLGYMGPSGSGHFVKMVHNGIEYGMMQAIAEGFEILKAAPMNIDLAEVAGTWRNGSIVSSYLMDITHQALINNPNCIGIADRVDASGEGLWTVEAALELGVPAQVITTSLLNRYASQQQKSYANQLLAAMRNGFGGHALHHEEDSK